ncbi:malate transporter [Propionigenium maris DSM 9537]|uniref:Malate transporter n=1 Tax=Propionigenium maris DSM 9537 TaxID=1123000 RepID=A0A9W6GNF0_9FUSO|nr:AEC family transporter [Propionigenium maris]GLI56966.1 malate transporter [Propionigenium maris DSM 9537]
MLNSLNSVVIIFTMIGIGFLLTKRGILDEHTNQIFSKLVINVSLPIMMVISLSERFTREELFRSGWWLAISFSCVILSYFGGKLLARVTKCRSEGVFLPMVSFSNTIFIGLPVNVAIFGERSLPYVFLFYLANTVLFWTLGVAKLSGREGGANIGEALKKLINPPLMGFIVGVFLIITGIEIYSPVKEALRYIGGITTPLSLFFIGTVLANQDLEGLKIGRKEIVMLAGKFFMAPAITIVILTIAGSFIEIPTLLKHVYLIQASMPSMTNVAIVSRYYNRDYKYASLMVGMSTLFCIFTIPIYSFALNFIK